MKKIHILFLCWIGLLLGACYEDKGNYDYTDRGDIALEGWIEKHEVVSLSDTLDITARLAQPENYEYLWLMYNTQSSFDYDTIGSGQHLLWPVSEAQGSYRLVLKVTAQADGYSQLFYADVVVTSDFSKGWFVVKDQEEQTDIDFFTLASERTADMLSQSVGRRLAGKALGMTLMSGFSWVDPSSGAPVWGTNMLYVVSEEDCWMVNLADISLVRDFSEMFFAAVTGEKPGIAVAADGNAMYFLTDRAIHHANTQGAGTGQFGMAFDFNQEVKTGNQVIRSQPGTVFYDQIAGRFLGAYYSGIPVVFSEDPKVAGTIPPVSMNHTGCRMNYMGVCKYNSEYFYALMTNVINSEKYIYTMYTPYIPYWNDPDQRKMGEYNLIQEVDTLKPDARLDGATLFAIGSSLPYIYFYDRTGNTVHYYDITGKRIEENVFPIPGGETVTYMKSWYFDATSEEDKFDKFVIATEKDGHYKVYLYDLLGGKPYPDKEPQVLKGEGTVAAVHPIRSGFNYRQLPANFECRTVNE